MKYPKINKLWSVLFLLLVPFVLIAQDLEVPVPVVTDANSLMIYAINATILGLSPWLVSLLWKVYPSIPKPILPLLAPLFGALAGYLLNLAGLEDTNQYLGAAAGAMGLVGRQFVKEAREKQAAADVSD